MAKERVIAIRVIIAIKEIAEVTAIRVVMGIKEVMVRTNSSNYLSS
jgi:hypothetical protein